MSIFVYCLRKIIWHITSISSCQLNNLAHDPGKYNNLVDMIEILNGFSQHSVDLIFQPI